MTEAGAVRRRLFSKFIWFLLPLFIAVSGLALHLLAVRYVQRETAVVSARVGTSIAKMSAFAAAEGRANAGEVSAALSLLMSDEAIMCAEVVDATGQIVAAAPQRIGCKGQTDQAEVSVPVPGWNAMLQVRYNDAEIELIRRSMSEFSLLALLAGLTVALFGSWIGFRMFVTRPMAALLAAIRANERGSLALVERLTNDELGIVAAAFNSLQRRNHSAMRHIDRLYHTTPALMFTMSDDGRVTSVSEHWSEATGHSASQAQGQLFTGFLDPGSVERFQSLVTRMRKTHAIRDEPLTLRHADGRHMHVLLAAEPGEDGADAQFLCVLSDVTELRKAEARLQEQALTDALTGLSNRKGLFEHLSAADKARSSQRLAISALFVDLDKFKHVNDTLGHAAGDMLLQQVAQRLRMCVLPRDFIARLGGDEFVLLLHDTDGIHAERVKIIARAVLSSLALPFDLSGEQATIGASVGLAGLDSSISSAELLRRADIAMYFSKKSGRSRITDYSDMDRNVRAAG